MPSTPEKRLAEAIGLPPQEVNNVWGQSVLGKRIFLTLPSGQTCWAKPAGLQGIMETGILGEADSLSAYVGKQFVRKVRGGKGKPDTEEIDAQALIKSPDTLKKIVKLVDGVTPLVVVEPKIYCHYEVINRGTDKEDTRMIPEEERVCQCGLQEDHNEHHDHNGHKFRSAIYTDMIGLEDKMFLFNFAISGVRDAESFRAQSQSAMGGVEDVQDLQGATEHPAGNRAERRRRPPRRR